MSGRNAEISDIFRRTAAYGSPSFYIRSHSLRCFKSQQIDACLQYISCQNQQTNPGSLLCFVLLTENLSFMIKTVELICQIIDIRTDLMRSFFLKGRGNHGIESGEFQHQCLLAGICRLQYCALFRITALFAVALQNGFDTHNCIQI